MGYTTIKLRDQEYAIEYKYRQGVYEFDFENMTAEQYNAMNVTSAEEEVIIEQIVLADTPYQDDFYDI